MSARQLTQDWLGTLVDGVGHHAVFAAQSGFCLPPSGPETTYRAWGHCY
ncbi:hypothetical protein [Chitinimonas prasina]|nr:hypothetical protein [Chitinimonas prasina]